MFARSRNTLITGGEFVNVTENKGATSFEKLQKASAPGAMHDSSTRYDPPKCHPNTRVSVLEYLIGWIFGHNDPEALILWLYGPAGAGKSAILQTIAELCAERKCILASFFFNRSDPARNTFKPLIPTIACQIAIAIPEIRPLVELVIERDPLILGKSIATQLQSLIIHPLKDLVASGFFSNLKTSPRLVIIDGLDECNDPKMQSMILRTLADALRSQKLPLIFLISSRPEQNIQLTFNSNSLAGLWKSLVLDDSYKPNDDIRTFLVDSFREIRCTHPHHTHIPNDWPSESNIDYLIKKSSGQFIYASVVIKYISASNDRPPHRFDVIMGLCPARIPEVPFAELDALYMHLLESCSDIALVMRILGVVLAGIFEASRVEMLLSLQPGDVKLALAQLSSIINISENNYILLSHASFRDFLIDMTRSSNFHVNTLTTREEIISTCVSMAMNPDLIINDTNSFDHDLGYIIYRLVHNRCLTDKIKESLMQLSLPHIWSISEFEPYSTRQYRFRKQLWQSRFVSQFLAAIDPMFENNMQSLAHAEELQIIFQFHLSAFQPISESEFNRYYRETELMHLVVLATIANEKFSSHTFLLIQNSALAVQNLLQLSNESILIDNCVFSIAHNIQSFGPMHYHFLHLWTPIPDGSYAQTALKILFSLCNHPPHHSQFRSYSVDPKKGMSHQHSAAYAKPSHNTLHHVRYLRLQLAKRHQYGIKLCMLQDNFTYPSVSFIDMCRLGLLLLPECLRRSPNSSELAGFIRSNGKKIPYIPKLTHEAMRAIHEYLARTQEDTLMDIYISK